MKKNIYSGKFIVFEGLDGSGQSTQTELLTKFLKKKKHRVLKTKEPTLNSKAGEKIREILDKKKKASFKKLQELFAKDRKEHLKNVIIPALKEGKIVISDRYFFSSFAYGQASGLSLDWLIKINEKFLMPDIVFFLDTKPEICIKRIRKRGDRITLFEEKEKLKKVYQNYKILIKKFDNVKIIKGEKSIREICFEIRKAVLCQLNKEREDEHKITIRNGKKFN